MQQLPSKRTYPFEDNPSLLINSTSLSGPVGAPSLNLKLDSEKLKENINSLLELGFDNRDINHFISIRKHEDEKKQILAELSLPLSIENINKLKAKGFEMSSIKEMIGRSTHLKRLELMSKDVFLAAIDKLLGLGLTHGFISYLVEKKLSIKNNNDIIEKLVVDENFFKLKYILENLEKQKISLQVELTKKGNLFDNLNELYQSYLSLSSPNLAEGQISMVVSSDPSQSQVLIDSSPIQTEGLSAVNEGSISVPDLQQVSKSGDNNSSALARNASDNSGDGQVFNEAQIFFNPLFATSINRDFNQPQSQVQPSKPESSFDIEIHSLPPMTHGDIEEFVNTCDSDNDQAQSSLEGHDQSDFFNDDDEYPDLTVMPILNDSLFSSPNFNSGSAVEIDLQYIDRSNFSDANDVNMFIIHLPKVVSSDPSQSQVLIDSSLIQTEGLSVVNEGIISAPDLQQVSKSGDTNLSAEVWIASDNFKDGQVSNEAQTFFNPLPAVPINQDFNQPQSQVQFSKPESSVDIKIHSLPPMTHGDIEGFVNTCNSDNDQVQSSLEGHDQSDFSDYSDEFYELTPLPISPSISYASDSEILTQGDHQSTALHTESMNAFLIPLSNSSTLSGDSHDGQVISRGEDEINRDAPELCEEDSLEFHKLIKNDQHYKAKFEKLQEYGFTIEMLIRLSNRKSSKIHKDFLDKLSAPGVTDSFKKLRQKGFEDQNIRSMAIRGPNCASNFIRLAQDDFLTAVDKLTKLGFEKRNLSNLIHTKGQSAIDDIIELSQDENLAKLKKLKDQGIDIRYIYAALKISKSTVIKNFNKFCTEFNGGVSQQNPSHHSEILLSTSLRSSIEEGDGALGATLRQIDLDRLPMGGPSRSPTFFGLSRTTRSASSALSKGASGSSSLSSALTLLDRPDSSMTLNQLIEQDPSYQEKFEKLQEYGFTVKLLITLSGNKSNDTHKEFLDKLSAPEVTDSFKKLRQKGFEDQNIRSMAIRGPNCASNFIRLAQDDFLTTVDKLTKLGFEKQNLSNLIHRKGQSAIDDIIELAKDENISKISKLMKKNVEIFDIYLNLQKPNFGVLENFHNYFAALITSIEGGGGGSLDVSARPSCCSLILLTSGSLGGDVVLGATQNQFNSAREMSSVHTATAVRQPSLSPMAENSQQRKGVRVKFR